MFKTLVNGQSAMKQELLQEIKKVDDKIDDVKEAVEDNGRRIDRLGKGLAFLEDDLPAIAAL